MFVGINKVIARDVEEDNEVSNNSKKDDNNNNTSSSSRSTSTSTYPCKVLKRYACPYYNKGSKIKEMCKEKVIIKSDIFD